MRHRRDRSGWRPAVCLAAALALAGCAELGAAVGGIGAAVSELLVRENANWAEPTDYQGVAVKTQRDVDTRGRIKYTGPIAYVDNDVRGHIYFLRAILPNDWPVDSAAAPDVLQLYVIANLARRTGLDRAWQRGGSGSADRPLEVTPIYQAEIVCTRGTCPYREDVGVDLTLDDLDRFAGQGLDLVIEGPHGRIAFTVPAAYFRAYRDRLVEAR